VNEGKENQDKYIKKNWKAHLSDSKIIDNELVKINQKNSFIHNSSKILCFYYKEFIVPKNRIKEVSCPIKIRQNLEKRVEEEWSKSMLTPGAGLNNTPSTHISRNENSAVGNGAGNSEK